MPAYRVSKPCPLLRSNPSGFKIFWCTMDEEGTIVAGNGEFTWYKRGDKLLPQAIEKIICGLKFGVDAGKYLWVSLAAKKFGRVEEQGLKESFLSHVGTSGVKAFLKWKTEQGVRGDWPDKPYKQQHTHYLCPVERDFKSLVINV
ncbi:hypothetical protein TEQG_08081 [Trichophyton equinum CBS 127.97]|uniref:Uncharacterized protein n=1 Tax=Trichophyton equinum (strain ATCC MYA-4606 / CBS 127.97) TaxID=559882 RepID=F2Q4I5_TRIEC|nr:hypothetical protein TEQG_08081 [Trichophyton equinum CBS 127.97]